MAYRQEDQRWNDGEIRVKIREISVDEDLSQLQRKPFASLLIFIRLLLPFKSLIKLFL